MPLIEELPVTTTAKASHGWVYVPDTGPIAAQQPGTRDRKRAAAGATRNAATSSAKREKAIQSRLDALNKENYKDGVSVAIPPRAGRDKGGRKVTSNVRRILAYQRTFAHYLADEEANHPNAIHYTLPALPTGMAPPQTPAGATPALSRAASKDTSKRKSAKGNTTASDASRPPTPTTQPRGTKRGRARPRTKSDAVEPSSPVTAQAEVEVKTEEPSQTDQQITAESDTPMVDAPPTTSVQPTESTQTQALPFEYPSAWDQDPLLVSDAKDVPPMPTDRVMQILISEPPLTFNTARAVPLPADKQPPARHFCGICGYWGRVKCKKCAEWTCGIMECWRSHEGVCPMANTY